jgi:hypothetical protein
MDRLHAAGAVEADLAPATFVISRSLKKEDMDL